jgi:hypothetical protein
MGRLSTEELSKEEKSSVGKVKNIDVILSGRVHPYEGYKSY